jgi:hypothetical protein
MSHIKEYRSNGGGKLVAGEKKVDGKSGLISTMRNPVFQSVLVHSGAKIQTPFSQGDEM